MDFCNCEEEVEFPDITEDCGYFGSPIDVVKGEILYVNFHSITVGTVARKLFRIQNEFKAMQVYRAKRHPNTNPMYQVFDLDKYDAKVYPNRFFSFTITYFPTIPGIKNSEYFQVQDSERNVYKICVSGESVGPSVTISMKHLYFYKLSNNNVTNLTIEITNHSDIEAIYQFDVNHRNQDIFKLNKIQGKLAPRKYTYINIYFDPQEPGYYSQDLFCLILYHEPIIVHLVGIYSLQEYFDLEKIKYTLFSYPTNETTGFGAYIRDSAKVKSICPPVTLSDNFLDFGQFDPGTYSKICSVSNCLTLVTCLSNHLSDEITVIWELDKENVFQITPHLVTIPAEDSVLYECRFYPTGKDKFFGRILTAQIKWIDKKNTNKNNVTVPINLSIRLIGHSFPYDKTWIPLVDLIPPKVLLPACIPCSLSCGTFVIKSRGHLPVLFKFLPPKKSNFVVKPMVGVIYSFQIIVVTLQPQTEKDKAYVEQWSVALNGQEHRLLPILMMGQLEWPSVCIGRGNTVLFNNVHPGCQDITEVLMKNTTGYEIKYKYDLKAYPNLHIDRPMGEINANETIYLKWSLTGHEKQSQISTVKCYLNAVERMDMVVGPPTEVDVTIYAKCFYSKLCAMPEKHDFGEVEWNTFNTTQFHLFNFCQSPIHFKLICKKIFSEKDVKDTVKIMPKRGTISPREKYEINLEVIASLKGTHEYKIYYQIRLNESSHSVINDGEMFEIFSFSFESSYPTLQIVDIGDHTFGPLFSKITLWEMFEIDQLNKHLRDIQHEEVKSVNMVIPDYELDEKLYKVVFIIENVSKFDTSLNMKRLKKCDCELVEKSCGISMRGLFWDCPHRGILKMYMKSENISKNDLQVMKMEVNYLLPGYTLMGYTLYLSHDRKIELNIHINCLTADVTKPSIYSLTYEINLKSVYLEEIEPSTQVFWLYNNSANTVSYKIDEEALKSLNDCYNFCVLNCLNKAGLLAPYTSYPLIFDFTPIEARRYIFILPVNMGTENVSLEITGEGAMQYSNHIIDMDGNMPASSKVYLGKKIALSTEHVVIDSFPVWSKTETMFFIRNMTKDRVIGYAWQRVFIEGVVEAHAMNRKGVLNPKECHAIVVQITSFDLAFRMRIQLPCKLLDHTEYVSYRKSIVQHHLKQQAIEDEFTIHSNGEITYPENDVKVLPHPEIFYTVVAISLHVYSTPGRRFISSIKKKMVQSPQFFMRLPAAEVLSKLEKVNNNESIELKDDMGVDRDNIPFLRNSCESILSDVLMDDFFTHIVKKLNTNAPPYYVQIKMDTNNRNSFYWKDLDNVLEETKLLTDLSNKNRSRMLYNFLKRPQNLVVTNVLKSLIVNSLHGVFQLSLPNKQETEENKKPHCECALII